MPSEGDPDRIEEVSVPDAERMLLTLEEAARRLSVGRTTLYELAARGELATVTIGRCRRVPVSSLKSFVDRLTSGHQAAPDEVDEAAESPASSTHPRRNIKRFLGRG